MFKKAQHDEVWLQCVFFFSMSVSSMSQACFILVGGILSKNFLHLPEFAEDGPFVGQPCQDIGVFFLHPVFAHRPLSSSFLGLPYRILNINHKKELLRGLWVERA